MKQLYIFATLLLFSNLLFAQIKPGIYKEDNNKKILTLTDNNFFNYQDLNNLIKDYLRGEWQIDNNQLILTEVYHSDINENDHSIRKAPKFEYSSAKRISIFKIDGNQLILMQQEVLPNSAKFSAELQGNFTYNKD